MRLLGKGIDNTGLRTPIQIYLSVATRQAS